MLFLLIISDKDKKNKEKNMQKYLDIDETAEFLKIKKATIYQMTHMQQIPHIKLGGKLLFDPNDLEKWLEGKKVNVRRHQ
ncbi:DNA-binding protein [Geovibrio thiophilus]|uniref:DNA-binding protein n=2 Tax=Geovibrio TaxID=46200 RepID=A0A3R6AXI4_9BACT|nr:helix-turn-helix domain-containing protein [Geovibrio thiophilus]QAR32757.1 DNA-binding protein [Geovibrio thiophilus]